MNTPDPSRQPPSPYRNRPPAPRRRAGAPAAPLPTLGLAGALALLYAALAVLGACASGHRDPYAADPPRLRRQADLEAELRAAGVAPWSSWQDSSLAAVAGRFMSGPAFVYFVLGGGSWPW